MFVHHYYLKKNSAVQKLSSLFYVVVLKMNYFTCSTIKFASLVQKSLKKTLFKSLKKKK